MYLCSLSCILKVGFCTFKVYLCTLNINFCAFKLNFCNWENFCTGKVYLCAVKRHPLLEEIAFLFFENILVFCFVDNFTKFCLPSNYAKGLQRPDRGVVPVCTDCYFAVGRITLYSQEYYSIVW